MTTAFGEALRRERTRRGERQREAAARFDVSQPSYHRWEAGEHLPDDELRQKVADYLGITVGEVWELMHGEVAPASLGSLQSEVADMQRAIKDLQAKLRELQAPDDAPSDLKAQ